MKKICIGIIGVGRIGKIHLNNLSNHFKSIEIGAISDIDEKKEKLCKDYGINKFYKSYKNLVLDKMDKSVLPGIKENIVSDFYLTPDYFEKDLATLHGSGFSIQPKFSQSAYFRFHNQSEVFNNLYFVGAGTHPGAGMPGVLSSAKVLDRLF